MPTLKLLAIADQRPQQSLTQMVQQHTPDIIVTLGDLDMFEIRDLQNISDIPKLGVYGNHCSGMYFDSLGITNMHLQTVDMLGVTFGGFEGCVRYKESRTAKMYTQEEASELLSTFPHVDVMLVHCPPYGVNDEPDDVTHQGFRGLRSYVEQEQPKHLLHGHTYPTADTMVRQLGQTQIHYVAGAQIVTLSV